ncbi:MAG: hypothetical protein ACJ0G8_03695 [Dehalococcoidia bacterium]
MNQKKLTNILSEIISHKIPFCSFYGENNFSFDISVNSVILSGSFNPLHDGHKEMLLATTKDNNLNPYLEISITNVDKESLVISDIKKTIHHINKSRFPLIISNSPRFIEKSNLFPNSYFLIGNDTFQRLCDNKYYPDFNKHNNLSTFTQTLDIIKKNNCKFIVAGRINKKNVYTNVDLSLIPKNFKAMFSILDESDFRNDISSTKIRNNVKE